MEHIANGETVILTITNQCNLNCIYCYENHKDILNMSFDTARNIIEEEFQKNQNIPIEFDFHGGEPLINFHLIKQICEWCWGKKRPRKYRFFGSTNGSLLTPTIKQWLYENRNKICLGLSLDGTPSMNKKNRGISISEDTLQFFLHTWPKQSIKMTISPYTIHNIAEGIIYAHQKGFKVSANLAYGIDWETTLSRIYYIELKKLSNFYLNNSQIEPCSIFTQNLRTLFEEYSPRRGCGAGKALRSYDTEGNCYPCHTFGPNTITTKEWEKVCNEDFTNNELLYEDDECSDCLLRNICSTCYGLNFLERHNIGKRDKRLCSFIQAEKVALSQYKTQLILQKDIKNISEAEYIELFSAKTIVEKYENYFL